MKQGQSLKNIAAELERQLETRKDYIAPMSRLSMKAEVQRVEVDGKEKTSTEYFIKGLNGNDYAPTDLAHQQIGEYVDIPKKYYDRMRKEKPDLLVENVNTWFGEHSGDRRMVRTLDGKARAFLSEKYRPLDNHDLAEVVLPILLDKGCQVESAALTETRLYVKAVLPSLQSEIQGSKTKGDIVQAGIVISNSEVGAGAVKIEPMIYRLVCTNGMIAPDASLRKYHVGKASDFEGIREILSDEAKKADDRAFWLKVRDVVLGAFDRELFTGLVNRMSEVAQDKIVSEDLTKVIEVTTERLTLGKQYQNSILRHLVQEGDLTRWGLLNAITRTAEDVIDYDQATNFERAGGRLLELPRNDWEEISEAA